MYCSAINAGAKAPLLLVEGNRFPNQALVSLLGALEETYEVSMEDGQIGIVGLPLLEFTLE